MMGMEILNPSTVVVMSILDTSISMRGRNLAKTQISELMSNGAALKRYI